MYKDNLPDVVKDRLRKDEIISLVIVTKPLGKTEIIPRIVYV